MEWIPRDKYNASGGLLPSNDFVWLANGSIECEQKGSAKWRTIRDHIKNAVTKGAAQGIAKDNFLVDLGRRSLSPAMRRNLERWNVDRSAAHVRGIWVLSENGAKLERIILMSQK